MGCQEFKLSWSVCYPLRGEWNLIVDGCCLSIRENFRAGNVDSPGTLLKTGRPRLALKETWDVFIGRNV